MIFATKLVLKYSNSLFKSNFHIKSKSNFVSKVFERVGSFDTFKQRKILNN